MIRAWWHYSSNFGDALTPYIINKLSGIDPIYALPHSDYRVVCITGSLLGVDLTNADIWGLGIIDNVIKVIPNQNIRPLSTRGPISASKIKEAGYAQPITIGDPAILLPQLRPIVKSSEYAVGLLQSWVDIEFIRSKFGDNKDALIIDTLQPVDTVIDMMAKCDVIVSSCLHGIVVAVAYGFPLVWSKYSDKMVGDGTKFIDFFESIGCSQRPCTSVDISTIKSEATIYNNIINTDRLLEVCPFNRK